MGVTIKIEELTIQICKPWFSDHLDSGLSNHITCWAGQSHVSVIMSESCHDRQIFQVQWLLRHGAVIKSDKFGKTPLSDAAENKQLEVKYGTK